MLLGGAAGEPYYDVFGDDGDRDDDDVDDDDDDDHIGDLLTWSPGVDTAGRCRRGAIGVNAHWRCCRRSV